MAISKDNPHKHHRERLRRRYLDNGLSSLQEHEILEMLLFYSIPVVNTNPLAHELLSKFGSLKNVLEASSEELSQISGLGEKSAIFLGFLRDIYSHISVKPIDKKAAMTYESMGNLFVERLGDCKLECIEILLLDAKDKIISVEKISEGSFDSAELDMRKIAQLALIRNAAKIAVAHNHPNGNKNLSISDKAAATMLATFLNQIGVEFVELYVIANGEYIGLRNLIK